MSIPANMLTEMKGRDRIYSVCEIDLSETLKFGETALLSTGSGMYLPFVEEVDIPARTANVSTFGLESGDGSVVINDVDRVLQKEFGGPFRNGIRGLPIRWKLVSPVLDPADHFTLLDGVCTNYGGGSGRRYRIEFAPRVAEFDTAFNIPLASRSLFPAIPQPYENVDLWLLYGQHKSSVRTGSSGMVKCVPVGEVDMWIVSVGEIEGVDAVYVGGVAQAAANWTSHTIGRASHIVTVVRFTASAPADTATVTVDCRGIADDPTGGGAMIENPIAIARNAVGNFVYRDGTTAGLAAWDDETAVPMATTILDAAETFYDIRGAKATAQIFSSDTPRSFVSAIGDDWNAAPFFTVDQEFAMKPEDPSETVLYFGEDAHIAQKLGHVLEFSGMNTSEQSRVTGYRVSRVLNRASGGFAQTFTVTDRRITPQIIKPYDIETSRANIF